METAISALELSGRILDPSRSGALKAESDVGCSIELARAAFRAAEMNVAVNLPWVEPGIRSGIESRLRELRSRCSSVYGEGRSRVAEMLRLPE
jgi:hypothetical protein